MKKVATIILNRNLPEPTNKLFEFLEKEESDINDTFIVEAGSNKDLTFGFCLFVLSPGRST